MVNITHKSYTLREAIALAVVEASSEETILAIKEKRVPKGDVFEFARAAALLAIKKTSDVIPDCHPLPVEFASVKFDLEDKRIHIRVEVHTVYKTGVEVEAMHGAMIAALTLYDMLKPIDKNLEIKSTRLESKKGGKSDVRIDNASELKCAVVVCSDRVAAGKQEDVSGKLLVSLLEKHGINTTSYEIVPDDTAGIQQKANDFQQMGFDLVLFTGGTGLSPRDVTPEAIAPLIDQHIPGIMEAFRNYGQQRIPTAMLSRGMAGFMKNTLLITLPGSPGGVKDAVAALFPAVLHVIAIKKGVSH